MKEQNGLVETDLENQNLDESVVADCALVKAGYIDFLIDLMSELNNTRLYWLWIKYVLSSLNDQQWYHAHLSELLKAFSPVTDALSYSIYITKISLVLFDRMQHPEKDTPSLRGDVLWCLSNCLTATYLCDPAIRPQLYTLGWWGNLSMQSLLVYDGVSLGFQYKQKLNQILPNNFKLPDTFEVRQLLHGHDRQLLFIYTTYATSLVIGFYLFRGGFYASSTLNPLIGSGLCVSTTILTYEVEWIINLKKLKKIHQDENKLSCLVFLSMVLGLTFPLIIWTSLDSNYNVLSISLGLSCMTVMNLFLKHKIKKEMQSFLLFKPAVSELIEQGAQQLCHLDLRQENVNMLK